LLIENVRVLPLGSVVVGVNEYAWPAVTLVGGEPLMVGGLLAALTVIEKLGSEALLVPSLTEIMMLEVVPTFASAGVPLSLPVEVLNVAHEGPLLIENVKAAPVPPAALGVNAYA
jgi:hypothetical protein